MKKQQTILIFKKTGFLWILFAWIFLLFFIQPSDKLKGNYIVQQEAHEKEYQLYGSRYLTQTFVAEQDFNSIDLYMENYNHTQEGKCIAKLYDVSGKCVYQQDIYKSWLAQSVYVLHLPEKMMADKGTYTLELSAPELDQKHCVKVYASDKRAYRDGEMKFAHQVQNRTLCFSVYTLRKNIFTYIALVIFSVSAVAWWINRKKDIVRTAVIILTGMGLCMLVLMAPFSSPDEQYHYNSALVLSNIMMGQDDVLEIEKGYYDLEGLKGHVNYNSAFFRVSEEFFNRKEQEDSTAFLAYTNGLAHPVIYLAPALGITAGRLLGLGFVPVYYMGRFCNLLIYIVLVILAIRTIPKYKELMLLSASLPMCLHQAVSYSYDVLVNGMALVFVAYVMNLTCRKEIVTWKNILILAVIGGILCPGKLVYIALMALVFLIPKERFINAKDRRWKVAVVLCSVALFLAITQYQVFMGLLSGGETAVTEPAAKYTVWFIIAHPGRFISLLYSTFATLSIGWMRTAVGSSLAGLTLNIHEYLICGFAVLLLLSCYKKDNSRYQFCIRQKLVCWLTVFTGVFLVMLALYTDTYYGASLITGVQGRYFIPFFLPFLFGIQTDKITTDISYEKIFSAYWLLQAGVINYILNNIAY